MLAAPGSARLWINGIDRVKVARKSGCRKLENVAMEIAITYLLYLRAPISLEKFIRTIIISKTIVKIIQMCRATTNNLKKHVLSGRFR